MNRERIERYLPGVIQRTAVPGGVLFGLLEVMEALQAPSEAVLAQLDAYFDPYRAPDSFIPYLASWVDLDPVWIPAHTAGLLPSFPGGLGRLRNLIALAADLSKWRGTARGLLLFLKTATGVQGYAIEENPPAADGRPSAFHLRIRVPPAAASYRALIERIVELEKPAYVTYELATEEPGPELDPSRRDTVISSRKTGPGSVDGS